MKRFRTVMFLSIVAILFLAGCSRGEEAEGPVDEDTVQPEEQVTDESANATTDETVAVAEEFIVQLSEGQYAEATENFDDTMAEQIGAEELQELWGSLEEQLGEFIASEYDQTESGDGYEVILIKGVFNDADATFQVTINENMEIAGFYIV
ncbi:DUF3887 domain-containing protein [Oceanobacillus alkalisoli]|uniref:DUF3887 domain-containing protein n=1 Tax=Oceanobacillus alkalisoli TaxID=2925113 RepID=UPI001EF02FA1|nr:DUF3887 domain-containing protein [Oceanobacillus alkalisoli]MCF3943753.1 DUF3887 domain-containing protein [Oceanobacillus alkalisoli]MCG5103693.1 DUF3887 domain-containing protein [Oceanobacillus alkalisoli]